MVGIGASAGGLEAFGKLLAAMPADSGVALVLIPHLDPTHASMMTELLGPNTAMPVVQAAEATPLQPDRVYVIPPHAYLSVRGGALHLSPQAPQGLRLPFDFFLNSLADEYRERAVAVVLSGTGGDGSRGLRAISQQGGLVIAQDPEEAGYDGMPRSAIATGAVNLVLPVGRIPQALVRYARHPYVSAGTATAAADADEDRSLGEIIALLRAQTSRDFAHYRKPTLLRRIRRRMAAAGTEQIADYVAVLRKDSRELELLAKDFLVHLTSFFRDPAAFDALAKSVISELVTRAEDSPIRVWVPGCTGEEAYSLAMLFFEQFAAQKRAVGLQIFASDISTEALEVGRAGIYPETIRADVSAERLQRFFTREERGYRVSRELRDTVVFPEHDLLADPPFSRLDLVSCRNLLIYLPPEEQHKVLSLLHFALRPGGYLFLGVSETIGALSEFFQPVSGTLQTFRRIGAAVPRERGFARDFSERSRALWPRMAGHAEARLPGLAETAQRLLLEAYAPAAVLVDRGYRALYFWGPTDRYLRVASGEPSRDALALLREGLTSRFRAAVRQASRTHAPVTIGGARLRRNGTRVSVRIAARPVPHDDEELVLVTFADEPERKSAEAAETPQEAARVPQLGQELDDTRKELESTIRELEESNQELSAINEEALSINEEFQSTNEGLETSKEELQSLNEELTTSNNELQETLERQRRTSDDLQNILNSSDAATLFLDEYFNIRFFTASAASRFNLIDSDVGRPLADLVNPFPNIDLIADARAVLASLATVRREVQSASGAWYTYRTSPYRTRDDRIAGVVISLSDISEMKAAEQEAKAARVYAEAIIDTVREPLIVLDEAMKVVSAGRSFYRLLGATPADTVGRTLPDSDARHLDVPALRAFLDRIKAGDGGRQSREIEFDLPPPLGRRTFSVTAEHVRHDEMATGWILVSLNDITDYRRAEQQLAAARQVADDDNLGKSRFLAAVSHDLRQPLQTLTFLHGVLRGRVKDTQAVELLGRAEETLDSMSGMLNALLDINRLEAGTIKPQPIDFPIDDLFGPLDSEYGLHARARGLGWRVVRSRLAVRSDPRLLEQMLRNLLSNAIRYTEIGRVLLGCRRQGDRLRIEVWDTGIGIAEADLSRIFGEYQRAAAQIGEDSLGFGLAIVQRLGDLLGHRIGVRSRLGRGSVFTIEVPLAQAAPAQTSGQARAVMRGAPRRRGAILVIEDDPAVRAMLQSLLAAHGHRTAAAASGAAALALLAGNGFRPDLIIADFVLPGGMNGAEAAGALRAALGRPVPVIFLTGDVRNASLRDIAMPGAIRLAKPVRPEELSRSIQQLLAMPAGDDEPKAAPSAAAEAGAPATVFVVDDDPGVRDSLRELLTGRGYRVEAFASGDAFLGADRARVKGCLLTDVRMPGMSGLELLARLAAAGDTLPAILITGHGDVAMAVEAMKAGAADFIEKPVCSEQLLAAIDRALRHAAAPAERSAGRSAAALRVAALTGREREVMDLIVAGQMNKQIAARLGIAQRTVETHRAHVMKKVGAGSLSDLIRLALAARGGDPSRR